MFKNLKSNDFAAEKEAKSNSVLIDVRTPEEWSEGIIPGALLMNIMDADFPNRINEMDKDKHYFIYCRSGARSANACGYMARQGFSNLHNLDGGIMKWTGTTVAPKS
jgi:rhodanese-related sulfurtransferase